MSNRSASPRRDDHTGTWSFVVDLPPAPDGSRRQARRRGFPTKKAAQEVLDKLRVSAREGTIVEPSSVSVREYLDGWLDALEVAGRAPSTIASYRWLTKTYIVPAIGGVRLQRLQPGHLDALYADLHGRGLSARTTRYVHSVIRKSLADGLRKGLVIRNVADQSDPPSSKAARAPEMSFWTPAELATFLGSVADDERFALYRLAGMTGMRRGEICGLRWGNVDLDSAKIHVRDQLSVVDRKLAFSERPKSDHGRRTVDLDGETVRVLRAHRQRQLERRLVVGTGWDVDHRDLVFCGPAGEPLNPDGVARTFIRRAAAAGLPTIRFHDLRHTHCCHLIAAGRNPKEISRRMGHASVAFTLDRYGHLMPEAGADAAAAVAALVDGASARVVTNS